MAVIASTSDDFYANYAFQSTDRRNNTIRVSSGKGEGEELEDSEETGLHLNPLWIL